MGKCLSGKAASRLCRYPVGQKIAITHLWHAIEPQTFCHLIVKYEVAEQHILGKYSNCNGFGVTMALLNSQYFKVAITQLSMCNRSETLLCDSLSKSR